MDIKGRDFSLLPKAVFTVEPGTAKSVTAAPHTPPGAVGWRRLHFSPTGWLRPPQLAFWVTGVRSLNVFVFLRGARGSEYTACGFSFCDGKFYPLTWAAGCPRSWSNMILGVSVKVLLPESDI